MQRCSGPDGDLKSLLAECGRICDINPAPRPSPRNGRGLLGPPGWAAHPPPEAPQAPTIRRQQAGRGVYVYSALAIHR